MNQKFKLETELLYQTQNDISEANNRNPFQYPLLNSIRFWGNYKINDKLGIAISPFAYYQLNSIISLSNDKNKMNTYEIRYSIASDFKQKITQKVAFNNRACFEYRDFQNVNPNLFRFRNKFGLQYEFHSKWAISCYDELLMNLNPENDAHKFDQNRIGFLFNFKFQKSLKLEFGYTFNTRLQKNKNDKIEENILIINAYYLLPFHKKVKI